MKKIFTLIAVAVMAMGAQAQEKFLFSPTETYTDGQVIEASANVTLTIGPDGKLAKKNFTAGEVNAEFAQTYTNADGEETTQIVYLTGGNNPKDGELTDGTSTGTGYKPEKMNNPQSGTFFVLSTKKAGEMTAGIILNSGKSFFITKSDGTMLDPSEFTLTSPEGETVTLDESYQSAEKFYGLVKFKAVAGESYYIFCTGSKISFYGYIFAPEGGDEPGPSDLKEVTLWEGTASVTGWANQPGFLSDGGVELANVNAKAGDIIRFYMTAPDNNWQVQLMEGHWSVKTPYVIFSGMPLTNEDGSPLESVVVDLAAQGYIEFALTEEMLTAAMTQQYWGNVFLMNGDGNITVTKMTIFVEAGDEPGPGGDEVKVSIADKFTGFWNAEETSSVDENGVITYNGKQWGGLSAWLVVDEVPADWSAYTKLVFEFAEPTPAACQAFVQTTTEDIKAWGNAGINKLECSFEGKDMSKVNQVALQAAEEASYKISAIYLVASADGIEERVAVAQANANAPIYNLAGVRVSKDYKGIVIQNGRKFILK